MVNNAQIDAFLNYNYVPFNKKQCIKRIFMIWLFSVLLCLVGKISVLWLFSLGIINLSVSGIFIFLIVKYNSLIISRHLCDGVFYLHTAIILNLASYRFMLLRFDVPFLLLVAMIFFLAVWILFFVFIALLKIIQNKYSKNTVSKAFNFLPFGLLGILTARALLSDLSQDEVVMFISLMFWILSLIICLPSINFLKVFFILKKKKGNKSGDTE